MSEKSEAEVLADMLERMPLGECDHQAAAKLRQLHEENAELRKANDAFGQRQEWWNERMFALEQQRDALLAALKNTGLFLHHCWCDVQMNDYSFERLNRQMAVVDTAIKAVEEGK